MKQYRILLRKVFYFLLIHDFTFLIAINKPKYNSIYPHFSPNITQSNEISFKHQNINPQYNQNIKKNNRTFCNNCKISDY